MKTRRTLLAVSLLLLAAALSYAQLAGNLEAKLPFRVFSLGNTAGGMWRAHVDSNGLFTIEKNIAAAGDYTSVLTPISIDPTTGLVSFSTPPTAGPAAAGTLTGTTLASNVVASSLTSVGTLTSLAVSGSVGIASGQKYFLSAANTFAVGTGSGAGGVGLWSGASGGTLNWDITPGQIAQASQASFTFQNGGATAFIWVDNSSNERMRLTNAGSLLLNVAALDADITGISAIGTPAFSSRGTATKANSIFINNVAGASSGLLAFMKTRAATTATDANTTIVTADYLGDIAFYGADGANYIRSGSIRYKSSGTIASTRVPGQFEIWTGTDAAPTVEVLAVTVDSAQSLIMAGIPRFNGTNSTGAGTPLPGSNSPAITNSAPYTWLSVISQDGSTVYIAAYK